MPSIATETTARPETADSSGITIRNPRTGDVRWTVPESEPEAVSHAVEVARSAASDWASTAPAERGAAVRAAAKALAAAAQELAELNASETGRPVEESLAG
ncbi:aldehyde dehydrogenase family protein, partial [Arthrobacter sp. ZGTC212]|uniref:aldehyde dehydrogenase family protein n=1 Tax=Arthrobacter sp. ZGTC212 TaxID=2058899 RepID=UPI0011B0E6C0